jgi:hypothetical protein
VKTPEQAAIWGGTAGEQFDPCYHEACDTFGNVNEHALEVNSDLIAFAQLTFAYSTESVNGAPRATRCWIACTGCLPSCGGPCGRCRGGSGPSRCGRCGC